MSLTKVPFSLIQVANNVTSTTVGNTTSLVSLTFDQNGVITNAANVPLVITGSSLGANPVFTGTITVGGGFVISSNTVTSNTTIPTGYNASFTGPMVVANNIVVSAANGARLVIV